jgi:SAM-dependent methyltransferase
MANTPKELSLIYHRRFARTAQYRNKVWQVLSREFFQKWIPADARVLDLGCGYGEFINNISAGKKLAMDLNPVVTQHLAPGVELIQQDCSAPWPFPDNSLDVIFTSNFFEHLPDKASLSRTLAHALRTLKPGGRLIAVGPNIKYLHGEYWDFYDHHVYLTETSLGEAMEITGYQIESIVPKFLPFTMVKAPEYPLFFVRLYITFPWIWKILGRQFLLVAQKPPSNH